MRASVLLVIALVAVASGEIFFQEKFDSSYTDRWVESSWKSSSEIGEWKLSAGKAYGDKDDKGLQTGEDARFYGISAEMPTEFDNTGKDLVLQFSVKHDQKIDCGGGYIKLLPKLDQAKFGGDSDYAIMFGPDICGTGTRKTHFIIHDQKKGENVQLSKEIRCETDELTHLYTLIIRSDDTYEVRIDNKRVEGGNLADDFKLTLPKQIKDPEQSKPDDWVDDEKMADPEDTKPEGYDDIPEQIPDPDAEKPEDWDDEDDGEWEAPMIDNPEYKGEWEPNMIDNPDYKGEWVHPMIDNPDYEELTNVHAVCNGPCTAVGFELWQVKAGTIFDDIIVTDSEEEAKEFSKATFEKKVKGEKAMHEKAQEEQRKKDDEEREKREAERKEEEAKKKEEEDAEEDAEAEEADDEDKDEL